MKCECCGQNGKLLEHHWFQPPTYAKRTKKVCRKCNDLLITKNFGLGKWFSHILPNWREQKEYVRQHTKYYKWNENFESRMRSKYGYHSLTLFLETESQCKNIGLKPDPQSDLFCEVVAELIKKNPKLRPTPTPGLRTRFGKLTS